jgi:hypothetical protein
MGKQGMNMSEQLLPNRISGRILDLEMECEKDTISKEVVISLINEYTVNNYINHRMQ